MGGAGLAKGAQRWNESLADACGLNRASTSDRANYPA